MNISIMDALRKTVASIKDFTNDGLNKRLIKMVTKNYQMKIIQLQKRIKWQIWLLDL